MGPTCAGVRRDKEGELPKPKARWALRGFRHRQKDEPTCHSPSTVHEAVSDLQHKPQQTKGGTSSHGSQDYEEKLN